MGRLEAETSSGVVSVDLDPIDLVTHELRTPLAVVVGAVEVLLERHDQLEPTQRRALLEAVRRHAQLMVAFVQRLGQMRELEWGDLRLDVGPVDLAALVHDLVRDLTGLLDPPPVIEIDDGAPLVVVADRPAVEEIMVILVSNAIDHGDGSPIRISLSSADGLATIRVRDHGPGIDPRLATRVFEPHTRGAARHPGVGIGLTLGRGLAEAHGGTLRLGPSPVGGGSAFHLVLPMSGPPSLAHRPTRPAPSSP